MKSKKQFTDPVGSATNALSKASDLIEAASNTIVSNDYNNAQQKYQTLMSLNTTTYGNPKTAWEPFTTSTINGLVDCSAQNYVYTPGFTNQTFVDTSNIYPKVDIEEESWDNPEITECSDVRYKVLIYLAGVAKKRIQLRREEGAFIGTTFYNPRMHIRISPERGDDPVKKYFLKESKQSFTNRIVHLPEDADVTNATAAELKNGILEFKIPRKIQPNTPTQIEDIAIK